MISQLPRSEPNTREAAYLLTNYIEHPSNWEFEPPFIDENVSGRKRVFLELGSGTGIVAAKISQATVVPGRDLVIATDLPEVCALLKRNLHIKSEGSSVRHVSDGAMLIRPLPWGSYDHAAKIARELQLIDDPNDHKDVCITHVICSDLVNNTALYALRLIADMTVGIFFAASGASPTHPPPSHITSNYLHLRVPATSRDIVQNP